MAESSTSPAPDREVEASPIAATATPSPVASQRPRQTPLHQIYKQPAPLRVFPLPSFANNANPISLVHIAVAWLSQVFFPPTSEPSVVHTAFWDHGTRSFVVTDEKSMAALWQQGFYGKGSLSRSEPNWLKREKVRRGAARDRVSEVNTEKRREDRVRAKWERARAEQEALEQRRLDEERALAEAALEATSRPPPPALIPLAPVGPFQLLALPNSYADYEAALHNHSKTPVDSFDDTEASIDQGSGSSGNDEADSNTTLSSDSKSLKRTKSVRFSPNVESTVFQHTDPPSPPRSVSSSGLKDEALAQSNGAAHIAGAEPASKISCEAQPHAADSEAPADVEVVNKEHLQLAAEEVFFLTFGLGALRVVDPTKQDSLSTEHLLCLLRQNSYFPPRSPQHIQPDDPFLLHYAVYHHFRSLGWVPRPGIKFGVDWLLYNRGPVFDHAEYGLLVLPSYADPHWKADGRQPPRKSWHWLMGVNRVLSKVFKSLVLVYVDVPPPTAFSEDGSPRAGMAGLLKQYKIREQMIKRWSSNRNR